MAVNVIDLRTVRNEADATTGWTGTTTLFTTDPAPVEATGELGATVGVATFDSYHTAASTDISNHVIYCWVFSRLALGNTDDAGGGLMVYVGDVTNAGAWKVAGADKAAFRHDAGPVGWQCPALDTTNLPASPLSRAGAAASVNFSAITRVGTTVNSLVAAPGMNPTYLVDIIRILNTGVNDGCALTIISGSSTNPGTFLEIVNEDRSTGSLKAHGVIRELGTGVYGVQGPLMFGTGSGTDSSWFEDKNASVIFEDRGFRDTLYKIVIRDNGTGTTTFKLGDKVGTGTSAVGSNGVTLTAPPGVGVQFDSRTDANVTDVFIYGSTFNGFSNGILLGGGTQEFIGNIVNSSGAIIPSGSSMVNCNINTSISTASVYWNFNLNPSGLLDGCSFLGSGSSHAIEFGPLAPASMSLVNISYTDYGPDSGSSSAVYNNSGKNLQITLDGGDIPTIRNGTGAGTTLISGLTTVTLTGLVNGTEVRVVNNSTQADVDGVESVVGNQFSFQAASGLVVDIVIHNIDYEYIRINSYTIPATTTSIPIEQRFDRNYST